MAQSQQSKFFDGVAEQRISVDHHDEGFKISRLAKQDCKPVLDHNKAVMAEGGSRTGSFGKFELCIPELELANIKRRFPDLTSPDMQIRVKAWKKYIRMAESKPWRVSQRRYD